jgi:hypothetical protein
MVTLVVIVVFVGRGDVVARRRRVECWIKCARRCSGRKRSGVSIGIGMRILIRMLVMVLDRRGKIIGLVAGGAGECWAGRVRLRKCVRRQRLCILLQAWIYRVVAHGVCRWSVM